LVFLHGSHWVYAADS
jgi:hypothetical protein